MNNRLLLAALAGGLLLGGCASTSGYPTAGDMLAGARESLVQDDLTTARQWLGGAESRLDTDRERLEYELLTAEVDLRSGAAEAALASTSRLLEDHGHDPAVHEMAGKAQLLAGAFAEASGHFTIARDTYRDESDVARAADLLALSRGFEAYARADLGGARDAWTTIQDHALRASVLDAAASVSPEDEERDAEPLAASFTITQ